MAITCLIITTKKGMGKQINKLCLQKLKVREQKSRKVEFKC